MTIIFLGYTIVTMFHLLNIFFLSASLIQAPSDPIRPVTNNLPKTTPPTLVSENRFTSLDRTIVLTERTLEEQKQLKKMVLEYVALHTKYKQNLEDRELSYQMVKKAHQVLSAIKELHIAHAFDQEFLSDLAFFSGIIERWEGIESLSSIE